ncbi:hypothetical protein IWQ60_009213 [Tieghemiomyces parasiticus]|uniref:RRM domain-containing protein n=1 Tax=Tieghemiomyces parasiticus TaxID=78921 RepID=A0A9W7ZUS4_9FUNG|nr:hypothetical protein IWQ60_009213 [Tieghemiomyces parasiticus]
MASNLDMDLDDIVKQTPREKSRKSRKASGSRSSKRPSGDSATADMIVDKMTSPAGKPRTRRSGGGSGAAAGRVAKSGGSSERQRSGITARAAQTVVSSSGSSPVGEHAIRIANLDPAASAEDLRTSFRRFGHIVKCSLIYGKDGRPSGDAEITYAKWGSANSAINDMNGVVADGRKLRVRMLTASSNATVTGASRSAQSTVTRKTVTPGSKSRQGKPTTFKVIL